LSNFVGYILLQKTFLMVYDFYRFKCYMIVINYLKLFDINYLKLFDINYLKLFVINYLKLFVINYLKSF